MSEPGAVSEEEDGKCEESNVTGELVGETSYGAQDALDLSHSSALNEQSHEVISVSSSLNMDANAEEVGAKAGSPHSSLSKTTPDTQSNKTQQASAGRLLSRLKLSSDSEDGANITSSIASALTSFSLFTSNFHLNSSMENNHGSSGSAVEAIQTSTSTKSNHPIETRESNFNKKVHLERSNLINLTKLIVKDLISSSLKFSRTIDDCQGGIHLNNYFTLVDRVLKHGLKQNLLSTKSASLWNALESLPKFLKESTLISESIRSLANTKTFDGKVKAWVRLALMQKKLPEYFNVLLENKEVLLKDVYHNYAFMLNDEAHVFAGLIIGVNVIDCNFFVKDDNFDSMEETIDLGPYLKNAYGHDDEEDSNEEASPDMQNLRSILDQKNYLEERNKRLESTISNLQSELANLEEKNSRLEMEVKVSEAQILKLQEKHSDSAVGSKDRNQLLSSTLSGAFKNLLSTAETSKPKSLVDDTNIDEKSEVQDAPSSVGQASNEDTLNSAPVEAICDEISDRPSTMDSSQDNELKLCRRRAGELEKELSSLKGRAQILETSYRGALEKIRTLERDLDLQMSISGDKDNTIKIYEKDVREKESQVKSLRASLAEFKKIQTGLHERLAETDSKMKDRVKSVMNLQTSLDKWKIENKSLATKLVEKQAALATVTEELESLRKERDELKSYNTAIDEELRRERESGRSSSTTVEAQSVEIAKLTDTIKQLDRDLGGLSALKVKYEEAARKCREYEQSLEEVGSQLRESRLEAEMLKENSSVFLDSQWTDSKSVRLCTLCQEPFSVTRRKHHCRLCGDVFCNTCSDNKMELASSSKPARVCDTCHAFLLVKFVKSSTQ